MMTNLSLLKIAQFLRKESAQLGVQFSNGGAWPVSVAAGGEAGLAAFAVLISRNGRRLGLVATFGRHGNRNSTVDRRVCVGKCFAGPRWGRQDDWEMATRKRGRETCNQRIRSASTRQ